MNRESSEMASWDRVKNTANNSLVNRPSLPSLAGNKWVYDVKFVCFTWFYNWSGTQPPGTNPPPVPPRPVASNSTGFGSSSWNSRQFYGPTYQPSYSPSLYGNNYYSSPWSYGGGAYGPSYPSFGSNVMPNGGDNHVARIAEERSRQVLFTNRIKTINK